MNEETRNLCKIFGIKKIVYEMQMRIRQRNIKTSEIKSFLLEVDTKERASNLYELVDMLDRNPFCIQSQEKKDEILKYLKRTINKMGDSTMNTAYDLQYEELTSVQFPSDDDLESYIKVIKQVQIFINKIRNSKHRIYPL